MPLLIREGGTCTIADGEELLRHILVSSTPRSPEARRRQRECGTRMREVQGRHEVAKN